MSDSNIGDEILATTLAAISVEPHGSGFKFVLVDDNGVVHATYVTREKLVQVFVHVGQALNAL